MQEKKTNENVVNSAGSGNIAGLPPDTPPVRKRSKKSRFAGRAMWVVDEDTYYKALLGKRKYEHFTKYLDGCDVAEEIREYARTNWAESIILQNEKTGAMVYLKYGSK
jgi:hypothetical protein